jgi:hypothetical protein
MHGKSAADARATRGVGGVPCMWRGCGGTGAVLFTPICSAYTPTHTHLQCIYTHPRPCAVHIYTHPHPFAVHIHPPTPICSAYTPTHTHLQCIYTHPHPFAMHIHPPTPICSAYTPTHAHVQCMYTHPHPHAHTAFCMANKADTARKIGRVMLLCNACGKGCHVRHLKLGFVPKGHWYCRDCSRPCQTCHERDIHTQPNRRLLQCGRCEVSWHMHCLPRPLLEEPAGTWHCPTCTAQRPRTRAAAATCPCSVCNGAVEAPQSGRLQPSRSGKKKRENTKAGGQCSVCLLYYHTRCVPKSAQGASGHWQRWVCPQCAAVAIV